jgi:hypothetical protein
MPTYEFLNTKTKKIEEHVMSISAYDHFKKQNPHLERYITDAPGFSYTGTGDFKGKKTDNTWKEVLSKISEAHPASALAQEHGKKTIKQLKTQEIFKKHAKKRKELAADRAKRK